MSVFGETLTGAGSGAMAGAPLGPAGAIAGGAIGGLTGFFRGQKRKKADSMLPDDQDPMQTGLLNELDRRVNNARTGANVAAEMTEIGGMEGAGLRALSRGGAGAMGSYGLMTRMAGDRRNKLLATGLQQENQLLGMKSALTKDMVDRKKFLDLLRSEKASAQGEQDSQDLGMGGKAMIADLFGNKDGTEIIDETETILPAGGKISKIGRGLNLGGVSNMQSIMGV